ncbi:glycerophosphodiester phosphodiesterase [Pseudogracilibacillus auburnensis]|uniref:glycerophosphodiester phosphodiesterase n=1 Tax=Pseudogracilibacillus auburnensis TaxID=1494959 RepID=UPI001A959C1E|nr:glycerophosphodiester phosphodiesterase [Pseudogracilibacillus auburnensis]MBO1003694.1 glycerophosphodiester phosphodiesterase [Pseudogracilibacillus auburnensis]
MKTKIFGHRGSSGTHPENTMAAFIEAEKVGADGIELDVHYTKDNQLAVIHDDTVDRTTNGIGLVRNHTLRELQQLDVGSWFSGEFSNERVPSLQEVFSWLQDVPHIQLNIELKYVALDYVQFEEQIVQAIEKYNVMEQVIISSFNHYALKKVNELNPNIECAILYMERLYEPWDYAKTVGATSLHPNVLVTEPTLLIGAKEAGFPVRVYTVNDEDKLKKLMSAHCPAIITDYPEKALKIRREIQGE